jgi:hypothetical protein
MDNLYLDLMKRALLARIYEEIQLFPAATRPFQVRTVPKSLDSAQGEIIGKPQKAHSVDDCDHHSPQRAESGAY